jgi:hypothetical protein
MTLPAGIQRDFGGFDPKFLGITLRVGSERATRLILTDPEARDSVRADQLLAEPEDQAFETLSLLTAFAHEHRHFHDFLLAPFGLLVFRRRVSALVNAMQVLAELHSAEVRRDYDVLPVPFSKWCAKQPEERARLIEGWKLDADRGRGVLPLPTLDEEHGGLTQTEFEPRVGPGFFAKQVLVTIKQYEFFDRTFGGTNPLLLPRHISEASALLVQAQDIWNAFGVDCLNLFLRTLSDAAEAPYGRSLAMMNKVLAAGGAQLHADRMSEIAVWSLLGDVGRDPDRSRAPVRFAVLGSHLMKNGYPNADRGVAEIFAEWDETLGYPPTLEGLRRSIEDGEGFVERLSGIAAEHEQRPAIAEPFLEAAEMSAMFQAARRAAIERFLADPDSYVHPEAYLEGTRDYPSPPLVVEIEGGALAFDDDPPKGGYQMLKGFVDEDGVQRALAIVAPHDDSGPTAIGRDLALRLRDRFATADVLFSPHAVDPLDFTICRDRLAESGFTVRQVLD